jgi:benzylsuccinate CoA-transferase BbsF subunit
MGRADLVANPLLATNDGRLKHRAEVESEICTWTSTQDVGEIEAFLQAAGVPVHRASTSADFVADPQLHHRGHFATVEHAEMGPVVIEGPRTILSRTPGKTVRPGPVLGEHNDFVLRTILGLDADEIASVAASGALA